MFVVNSASPYRNLKDMLDAAKAKPGELTMAAVGPGSTFQMGFTSMTKAAGVSMTYVPYQGSAPAVTAVMGQHVTSAFAGYAVVAENVKADKLRALGVATARRIEPLPNVATFDEQGFKGLEVDNWFGIVAPAGTPKDVLAQLASWLAQAALADPEVKARARASGALSGRPVRRCVRGLREEALRRIRRDDQGVEHQDRVDGAKRASIAV